MRVGHTDHNPTPGRSELFGHLQLHSGEDGPNLGSHRYAASGDLQPKDPATCD